MRRGPCHAGQSLPVPLPQGSCGLTAKCSQPREGLLFLHKLISSPASSQALRKSWACS
jgi:hypothetical protein